MFNKKKLSKQSWKEKILEEFNNGSISYNMKDYNDVKEVYDEIKKEYELKISKNEIEIKYEKIRLEKNLEKYNGDEIKDDASLYIAIIAAVLTSAIQEVLKDIAIWAHLLIIVGVIFGVTYFVSKSINRIRPIDEMKYISLKVLDDIEKNGIDKVNEVMNKNIPSKKMDTCLNKTSELSKDQSHNSEGKKHFIDRIKFKKYCSLFSGYFNKEIDYKKSNMDVLVGKIYDIYDSIADCKEKTIEKINLEDKISEYTLDINNGINTIITAVLTLFSSFAIQALVVMLNNKNIIYYEVFKGLVYTFLGFAIYCLFFYANDILTHKTYKGFYTLCLNTLKSVNEDKKHQNK